MSPIRLLSTDFDGTLIAHPSDGRCCEAFADVLERHKAAGGLWAINTGRTLDHAIEGVERFSGPIQPDFLLTNEREIFHRDADGIWRSYDEWNLACYRRHDELFERSGEILARIRALVESSNGITLIEEDNRPVGLVTSSEDLIQEVAAFLDAERETSPDFCYQRNTVYMRFCHRDYHKGAALGELTRWLGLERDAVLAAGDHFNDIPMLDGRFAAFVCCPSNAIPEVQETVRRSGGFVASRPAAEGIAEAWRSFHS